jgi:uncharacterized membrane protein YcfT
MRGPQFEHPGRVDWVDYAKGICIVMVVTMHSTLGVEAAAGTTSWMHALVDFAKPFRMPDFFLISGLFLARAIDRDWKSYLDRKVLHFAYFYALWVTIQFAFKAPGFAADAGLIAVVIMYLLAFIEPFGTLWFIYLLPIFFVVTKLARRLPPVVVFIAAAVLETMKLDSGHIVIDEFAARYVYFFTGYWLAEYFFTLARNAQSHRVLAAAALAVWALCNGTLIAAGLAGLPFISLLTGFAGALAVITISALLAQARLLDPLRHAGEHSLAVYLAFFLPMAATRMLLLKTGVIADPGTVAVIVTAAGVIVPLLLQRLVRGTSFGFLFMRPGFFRIERPRRPLLQPAE